LELLSLEKIISVKLSNSLKAKAEKATFKLVSTSELRFRDIKF